MNLKQDESRVSQVFRKARHGTDKFILVQKYRIHYVEAGKGEPVILIPGSYSTYRAWNRLMPLLEGEYRLIALDYIGAGDSDKPSSGFEYTINEQTDLIAQMIRQMELGKVNLVGGAYGGAIVFDFAARYPEMVNKIVSIEGGVIAPEADKDSPLNYCLKLPVIGDLFIKITRTGVLNGPAMRLATGKWYREMSSADRKEVMEHISSNAKSASRVSWYKISLARKSSLDMERAARSIKAPILFLYGTKSDFKEMLLDRNIAFLKTYLPHAWIIAVEGGIYDLAMQKPGEVAALILEFLRQKPVPKK
jgi:pimeloyl-ACP methyl ester carboxylesterase